MSAGEGREIRWPPWPKTLAGDRRRGCWCDSLEQTTRLEGSGGTERATVEGAHGVAGAGLGLETSWWMSSKSDMVCVSRCG
jgi:hypothetical protein